LITLFGVVLSDDTRVSVCGGYYIVTFCVFISVCSVRSRRKRSRWSTAWTGANSPGQKHRHLWSSPAEGPLATTDV